MFIQLSRIFHEMIWLSYWLIYKFNLPCYKFRSFQNRFKADIELRIRQDSRKYIFNNFRVIKCNICKSYMQIKAKGLDCSIRNFLLLTIFNILMQIVVTSNLKNSDIEIFDVVRQLISIIYFDSRKL